METIEIECIACGQVFEFTIDEQRIYNMKKFDDPKRCPGCRKSKLKVKAFQIHRHDRNKAFEWSQVIN